MAGLEKEVIVTDLLCDPWRLWNSDSFPSMLPSHFYHFEQGYENPSHSLKR